MKKKIIIAIIAAVVALAAGTSGWYFGIYKPQKESQRKNETCETIAVTAFINAFGKLDDIYQSCRGHQLRKLYAENKRKEGLDGATLEDHKKVEVLCDCAVKNLLKSIAGEWVGKCREDNMQWIQDSLQIKNRSAKEPGLTDILIEPMYEICETEQKSIGTNAFNKRYGG